MKRIPLKFLAILFLQISVYKANAQLVFTSSQEAVDFAVTNSKSYSLQRLSLEASAQASQLNITAFLPRIDLAWTEDDSVKIGANDTRARSVKAGITQKLFDGGKSKANYEMNKMASYFSLKTYETELNAYRAKVIDSYYSIVQLQQQLLIEEQLEENARDQLEIMAKEAELGLVLENDYLEYLISFRKIQDERKQYVRELRTRMRTFAVLIGLDPECKLTINDNLEIIEEKNYAYLENHVESLWKHQKNLNPALKKEQAAYYYAKQQYSQSNRAFLPSVSVNGGLSFSGTQYPLNNPSYTLKFIFSFDNNPLFPLTVENGYGFDGKRLESVNNGASVTVVPQLDYFVSKRAGLLSLNSKKQSLEDVENALYEQLFQLISAHDDCIDTILRTRETLELQQRRIEVSKGQVEKGLMKKIDYLNVLQQLAQQKIALMQAEIKIQSLVKEIEIAVNIPFGGLTECIKQISNVR